MQKITQIAFFLFVVLMTAGFACATDAGDAAGVAAESAETGGKWSKAGDKIVEAAKAVGEASGESWDNSKDATNEAYEAAKEKSAEVWSKTKEKSGELLDKSIDASSDAGDKAAEKSKEAWGKTKEGSKELMEKTKAKVHEMTAPEVEAEASPEQ